MVADNPKRPPPPPPDWPPRPDEWKGMRRPAPGSELADLVAPAVRLDIAKFALNGLLASGGDRQNTDAVITRAVRYADALLEALNRTHEEVRHANGRR